MNKRNYEITKAAIRNLPLEMTDEEKKVYDVAIQILTNRANINTIYLADSVMDDLIWKDIDWLRMVAGANEKSIMDYNDWFIRQIYDEVEEHE